MRILVTGAGGLVGREVIAALLSRGRLASPAGVRAIEEIVLIDAARLATPDAPAGLAVSVETADLADAQARERVFSRPFDGLLHLAAALTADAERDFERGLAINLLGLIDILEHCRRQKRPPRLVFSSSMAAYGGALPDIVDDATPRAPATSYGAHKVAAEVLIGDYSRRGFLDGRSLRLPVILIRPAGGASSLSDRIGAVVRDPLHGLDVDCPLAPATRMPVASARAAAQALVDLYDAPAEALEEGRAMNLPALTVTAAEMVAALEPYRGVRPLGQVRWRPDPAVQALIGGMPQALVSRQASRLGLRADRSFAAILDAYLQGRSLAGASPS